METKRWYVAVGRNVWGRGNTPKKAVAQLRRAGGPVVPRLVYLLPEGAEDPHVDDCGSLCWDGPAGKAEVVEKVRNRS